MYVHVRAHVAGGGEEGTGGEWRERGAGHGNHSSGGGPMDTTSQDPGSHSACASPVIPRAIS